MRRDGSSVVRRNRTTGALFQRRTTGDELDRLNVKCNFPLAMNPPLPSRIISAGALCVAELLCKPQHVRNVCESSVCQQRLFGGCSLPGVRIASAALRAVSV
jgi:hypothetical protein